MPPRKPCQSVAKPAALGLALASLAAALAGCASAHRPSGPPQASAYAPIVWQGTPPALHKTRMTTQGR